jgi:hypothetical protein
LRIGLRNQIDPGVEPAMMDDRIAGIARREQHLQGSAAAARLLGEDAPVHAVRQADIGEQQIEKMLRKPLDPQELIDVVGQITRSRSS